MHERLQRRVCRVIFLGTCFVPTLCVLMGAVYFHRPWQERDWQRELERELHLQATIGSVQAPRPGVRVLKDVEIRSLRTDAVLAKLDRVRLGQDANAYVEHMEIDSSRLGELAAAVQTWFNRHGAHLPRISIDRFVLSQGPSEACASEKVTILSTENKAGGPKVSLVAVRGEATLRLVLEQQMSSSWSCVIDSTKLPLPTWLLSGFVPAAARCGGSEFAGTLQVATDQVHVAGKLRGTYTQLDLQSFLGSGSPHLCTGSGQLQLDEYQWQDDSVLVAAGSLEAGAGQVTRSLVEALSKWLNFQVPASIGSGEPTERLDIAQTGCRFRLDAGGLWVRGNASNEHPGCVLLGTAGPVLNQPAEVQPSLFCLAHVFYPHQPEGPWLPANRGAIELSRRLPVFGTDETTTSR